MTELKKQDATTLNNTYPQKCSHDGGTNAEGNTEMLHDGKGSINEASDSKSHEDIEEDYNSSKV